MKSLTDDSTNCHERPTIISALMTPSTRHSKSTVDNLEDEAYTVITAAADTTGNAMTTIVRSVVTDSKIYEKLHAELRAAFPEESAPLHYKELENLSYLVDLLTNGVWQLLS